MSTGPTPDPAPAPGPDLLPPTPPPIDPDPLPPLPPMPPLPHIQAPAGLLGFLGHLAISAAILFGGRPVGVDPAPTPPTPAAVDPIKADIAVHLDGLPGPVPNPPTPPAPPGPPAGKYGLAAPVAAAVKALPDSLVAGPGLDGLSFAFYLSSKDHKSDPKALAAALKARVKFWVSDIEHAAIKPVLDVINGRLNALGADGTFRTADDYRAAFREILDGLEAPR